MVTHAAYVAYSAVCWASYSSFLTITDDVSPPVVAYLYLFFCTSSIFLFTCWYAEELHRLASVTSLTIVSPHQVVMFVVGNELPWGTLSFLFFLWASLSCHPFICSETLELHMAASIPDVLVIVDDIGDRFICGEVVVLASAVRNEFNLPSPAYSAALMPWS